MMPVGNREIDPSLVMGTSEHALAVTKGRHPAIRDALQWLTFAHLPLVLRRFSQPFYQSAMDLIQEITTDSPELTTALNKLIESKDSAVRAGIKHDTGRAGSVARPQEVVSPPRLSTETNTGNAPGILVPDGRGGTREVPRVAMLDDREGMILPDPQA